jgi:hypothetical protein
MGNDTPFRSRSAVRAIRQTILVLALLAAVAALGYDFLIVRPKFKAAWEKIQEVDNRPESTTNVQVRELLGMVPASTEENERGYIETFEWQRPLPFLKYKLNVVYHGSKVTTSAGKEYMFYSATTKEPGYDDFPAPPEKIIKHPPTGQPLVVAGVGAVTDPVMERRSDPSEAAMEDESAPQAESQTPAESKGDGAEKKETPPEVPTPAAETPATDKPKT